MWLRLLVSFPYARGQPEVTCQQLPVTVPEGDVWSQGRAYMPWGDPQCGGAGTGDLTHLLPPGRGTILRNVLSFQRVPNRTEPQRLPAL